MTDFRVELPYKEGSEATRELDWDQSTHAWSLSEKEYGDVRWIQGLTPAISDFNFLRDFFIISSHIDPRVLSALSPAELCELHRQEADDVKIIVMLCPLCSGHWIVDRRGDDSIWRRYGRTCSFSWLHGRPVETPGDPNSKLLPA